jgi:hypothetical protein
MERGLTWLLKIQSLLTSISNHLTKIIVATTIAPERILNSYSSLRFLSELSASMNGAHNRLSMMNVLGLSVIKEILVRAFTTRRTIHKCLY